MYLLPKIVLFFFLLFFVYMNKEHIRDEKYITTLGYEQKEKEREREREREREIARSNDSFT